MKWLKLAAIGFFIFPAALLRAAPNDTTWILTDDTLRQYNDYSVCDTLRDPLVGDSACLTDDQKHCDTGAKFNGTPYINFDYQMHNGYAGFKIDWDAGSSRYDATGYDSLIIYHKGPSTDETVTINFGASSTCGAPTLWTKLGTFSGSTEWKREALILPSGIAAIGLYELQVLINNQSNLTASGNFKLDNMFFIKRAIKLQANAPVLSFPADNTLNQPLKVNLAWSPVSLASSYTVEISSSADFITGDFIDTGIVYHSNTIYSQSGITTPSTVVSGIFSGGKSYYWRVNASNIDGTSPWASAWSYTTNSATIGSLTSIPALVTPAANATDQPLTVNLTWSPVSIATSYSVQVSTDANFGSTVFNQTGIASPSATVSNLTAGTTYYWRANASNQDGTSSWSDVGTFGTAAAAAEPAKKKSGCGSGIAFAMIPPVFFKAASMRKRKQEKKSKKA